MKRAEGIIVAMVLAIADIAIAQQADMPFYTEQANQPNVMYFIDNTGYMHRNVDGRRRIEVIRDVLIGTSGQLHYDDTPVYIPHPLDSSTEPERWVLDDIEEALVHIVRVSRTYWGIYYPDSDGHAC